MLPVRRNRFLCDKEALLVDAGLDGAGETVVLSRLVAWSVVSRLTKRSYLFCNVVSVAASASTFAW